jgi:predicted phage tail protein
VILAPAIYRPTASAELTWTQNTDTDFARYDVHTSTTPNFTPSEATLAGTVNNQISTTYTVGSLSHLTTHYFRVRVFDQAGQHTDSNVQSLFVP